MTAKPQTVIDREASGWLARRRLTRLSVSEEEAFGAWSAADPRHAETYEAMSLTLEDVSALRGLAELEPLEDAPRAGRRAWTAGIGAVAAALVAVVALPSLLSKPDIEASTLVAEIRPITLPDGTHVTLGAKSEIKVRFGDGERRVELTRGDAFFDIAANDARPFVVDAGGTLIRDIGTKFDVRRRAGKVEVGVLEGIVEVEPDGLLPTTHAVRRIEAGQRVRARETGFGPIVASVDVGRVETAPAPTGAWREGQLAYDDTALTDVVADLNRYYRPGVKLASADIGKTRLAASFKVDEIDKFLTELPSVAAVKVVREDDGAVTIVARPSASAP